MLYNAKCFFTGIHAWTTSTVCQVLGVSSVDVKLSLVGGIPTPLKNISRLELLFPIYGKIKNVPNHQPDHVTQCCRAGTLVKIKTQGVA